MSVILNPGGIRVVSARLLLPYRGVWMADLQLDPEIAALAPSSGPVQLVVLGAAGPVATLLGTVDKRGTGGFSSIFSLRVVGGGGGWDQAVAPQHYHNDAGVISTEVYSTTGVLVGEKVANAVPQPLGVDFWRSGGRASQVLDAEPSWWVDPTTGVTTIGPRPPAIADPSMTLVFWDAAMQAASLTCDTLVLPGTPLVDPRLGTVIPIVRDVEQIFDAQGSRVTAWCGVNAGEQLVGDLRSMVREFAGVKTLKTYLYRLVAQGPDGRLQLQAVHRQLGIPDTLPIAPWAGMAGLSAKLRPGSTVRLAFLEGDPSQPLVDGYAPGVKPLELDLDADALVRIGGAAAKPLATGPWAAAVQTALVAFATGLNAGNVAAKGGTLLAQLEAAGAAGPITTTKAVAA